MKKFLCILLSIFQIFVISGKVDNQENLVKYQNEIQHIFIHSLIAYPEILNKKPTKTIALYKKDCIDYLQFERLLTELYQNQYVLIDIHKAYFVDSNGNVSKQKVLVPKGKKPLVLSVDDVVYDSQKKGNGMVDKLALDGNGNIVTETCINGKIDIRDDREFAPILEKFIQKNPDFSFENARATINLTGFCGILGYRVTDKNQEIAKKEQQNVLPVVSKLKQLGYNFACHSFGHYHTKKTSENEIRQDLVDWQTKIEPIIGKTDIFVFPYGEYELTNGTKLSEKQKLLSNVFKLFLGVGIYDFFGFAPFTKQIHNKILSWDRKAIDGFNLANRKKQLSALFDTDKVL